MLKTLVLGSFVAALALSSTAFAAPSSTASNGWKTLFSAETCFHNGRTVKMHTLNGEMRKTQCFNLQSKVTKAGERSFQYISRDGTVTKKGRRLS